jgi:hypothetical protein
MQEHPLGIDEAHAAGGSVSAGPFGNRPRPLHLDVPDNKKPERRVTDLGHGPNLVGGPDMHKFTCVRCGVAVEREERRAGYCSKRCAALSHPPKFHTPDETIAAFWAKVEKDSGCWQWTGSKTKSGYGNIGVAGRTVYAHRFAYEIASGPIAEGLTIDHLCRNRT